MRRRHAKKRETSLDFKFGIHLNENDFENIKVSKNISKTICCLMYDGKKSVAEKIFYTALEEAAKELEKSPLEVYGKAIENIRPSKHVVNRRSGNNTYQVPREITPENGNTMAVKMIVTALRKNRKNKDSATALKTILVDSYNNKGPAVEKKEEMYKIVQSNLAFSHFRW